MTTTQISGHHRRVNRVTGAEQFTAAVLLALFCVVLALIVFVPADQNQSLQIVSKLARFAEQFGFSYRASFNVIEFSLNIVLFIPVGALFPLCTGTVRPLVLTLTVLLGAAASAAIEWTQLVIPGRVSTGSDVLANTMGTLCGVLLLVLFRWIFQVNSLKRR